VRGKSCVVVAFELDKPEDLVDELAESWGEEELWGWAAKGKHVSLFMGLKLMFFFFWVWFGWLERDEAGYEEVFTIASPEFIFLLPPRIVSNTLTYCWGPLCVTYAHVQPCYTPSKKNMGPTLRQ